RARIVPGGGFERDRSPAGGRVFLPPPRTALPPQVHLCPDGQRAQRRSRAWQDRWWRCFRKPPEVRRDFLEPVSDGRLDLRADEPADRDKHSQTEPYGQGGIETGVG